MAMKDEISLPQKMRLLASFQGLLYLATGLWPMVSMASYLTVTGPKTDLWLVKTVGLFIAICGLVLLDSGLRKSFPLQVLMLAIASSGVLVSIDITYAATGVISPIYLYDALVEFAILTAWIVMLFPLRRNLWRGERVAPLS